MNELGKIPPQAVELEEAIIGALLVEGNLFTSITEYIGATTFYKESHQKIFRAIEQLFYENEPIDIMTVNEKLRNNGIIDEVGGAVYLAQLSSKIGSGANIEYHAKVIAEKYIRREIIRLSTQMNIAMYDEMNDLLEEISSFDKEKNSIISFTKKDEKHISEAIHDMKEYSIKLNSKEIESGYPTGFAYYDKFSGGIQRGDLIIIAGETSNGKTTLALNMAKHTADADYSVCIFSYEMTLFQLTARIVAHDQNLSSKDIIRGEIDADKMNVIDNSTIKLKGKDIYLVKPPGTNFSKLIADIVRMVNLYGIKVVYIDYLQLLSNAKKNASQADMVAEMANRLKSLAVELDIGIVLLSQLARNRDKPRPTLARLKGSGDIENAADTVIFTYLPYKYGLTVETVNGESKDVEENAIIIVAKGRNIGTTEFMLKFKKDIPAFYNYFENPYEITSENEGHFDPF